MVALVHETGLNISEVVMENEHTLETGSRNPAGLMNIWRVMKECIYRGCHTDGMLPGGLNVKRRASALNKNYWVISNMMILIPG